MIASRIFSPRTQGTEEPPGITASRLSQPPRMPPQCFSISSSKEIDISSSTTQGLFTWPEMPNSLVPALFGRPKPANHSPPRRRMVGTTAMDSTLFTVVGQPYRPAPAGNGGFMRGMPFFAFEAFQKCGFFAANVGACPMMQEEIKVPTRTSCVFAQKASVVSFVDCGLQCFTLADVFTANVDVAGVRVHRERGNQGSFDQRVRIVAHDFAIFTGARLGFISVDDQVGRATIAFLRHEGPLQTGWETRTATPT
mmetsp:Transcript_31918/g.41045  ORF Transcript_31918/g.41045 Transcript_31918/m.41045 type:complete len:253 (+) Transcript_31918:1534-2292(+)